MKFPLQLKKPKLFSSGKFKLHFKNSIFLLISFLLLHNTFRKNSRRGKKFFFLLIRTDKRHKLKAGFYRINIWPTYFSNWIKYAENFHGWKVKTVNTSWDVSSNMQSGKHLNEFGNFPPKTYIYGIFWINPGCVGNFLIG